MALLGVPTARRSDHEASTVKAGPDVAHYDGAWHQLKLSAAQSLVSIPALLAAQYSARLYLYTAPDSDGRQH